MKKNYSTLALLAIFSLFFSSCSKDDGGSRGVNIFSVNDDISMGKEVRQEVINNPEEFGELLDSADNPEAYQYLYDMQEKILGSGKVNYDDRFPWRIHILEKDELNAFATPGGYHFYYTGLIKYLDAEDELAGVMAHEMAHADRRHGTSRMTKQYGIQTALKIALGEEPGLLADVATQLYSMSYSRKQESEADEFAVRYMCNIDYTSDAVAAFFRKMEADGHSNEMPAMFSTHPPSDERIENAENFSQELNCSGNATYDQEYADFKALLP